MLTTEWFQWSGSIAGIAGALLMARNTAASRWAYPAWVLSSISMLVFAVDAQHYGLALQQGAFTAINLVGLWHWLIRPRHAQGGCANPP